MEFAVEPVQRHANVVRLSLAMAVFSLAQPKATKIEAQHRKSKTVQRFHPMKHNLVVHGAAVNRMRMTDQSSMTRVLCAGVEQRFEASCGAIDEQRTNCAWL